jgi:hypothetical protein
VAQKLNSQYGFSYDNLKVLLGGWNGWKEANQGDPFSYPIATGPNPGVYGAP